MSDSFTRPDLVIPGAPYTRYPFGDSLATWNDELLIGAPYRDYGMRADEGIAPPAAYLFRRGGGEWKLVHTFEASDPPRAEGFARSLSLDPSYASVGAPGHENGDDVVHDFKRASGGFEPGARRDSPTRAHQWDVISEYGVALASDDRTLLVGASLEDSPAGEQAGVVYVFDRQSAAPAPVATLSGRVPSEGFGSALALSGDLLIVGADAAYSQEEPGAAYIFRRDAQDRWQELARVPGQTPAERFGCGVALDGSRFAVIAHGVSNGGRGRLELFELVGGEARKTATFPGDGSFDAVALRGKRLALGQSGSSQAGGPGQTGRVGLLRVDAKGRLEHESWLVMQDAREYARLGGAVVLGADFIAAGAPGLGEDDGSGFVALKNW